MHAAVTFHAVDTRYTNEIHAHASKEWASGGHFVDFVDFLIVNRKQFLLMSETPCGVFKHDSPDEQSYGNRIIMIINLKINKVDTESQ